MDNFRGQAKAVPTHIPSKYSAEMALKSEVVSSFSAPYNYVLTTVEIVLAGTTGCLVI